MIVRLLLIAVMLLLGRPALAQDALPLPATAAGDAPVTTAAPETAIATKTGATDNADIAGRIRNIFSEITALRDVQVRVSAGVVTLTGTVPGAEDVARAGAIAGRVAGVVTVQNDVTRDLKVTTNLTPALSKFNKDIQGLLHALPLLGVAFGIGLAIVALGYLLASIERLWRWVTPNAFLAGLAATFVRFVAVVLGIIAALEVLGATALLSGVLGGAGVIGIALGFAVRDTVDNYVSSLMLSLRQPFRANDHVVIEGNEGRVIRLTSRATVLMTLDGNHLRIPNSIVFKAVILNYTRNSQRRFSFDLGVDADDDPLQGMTIGLAALNALPFVIASPRTTAIIENVGDSNIVLRFFGWVDQADTDFLKGRSLAINAAAHALTTAGFALPEPIYRLRFDESAPLAFKGIDAAPAEKPPVPARATEDDRDTSPDSNIAEMVTKERADTGKEDLLDNRRPIE